MPTQRISMRKLREVCRLRFQAHLSLRQISHSTQVSLGAIQKIVASVTQQGLDWPAIQALDDAHLSALIYPKPAESNLSPQKELPDWADVHREVKPKGMTLQLLWEEYAQQYPTRCFSYSQYFRLYNQWLKKQKRSMRQTHKAGEKLFVDYAGQTVPIVSHVTGEMRTAQIFVAVLGASNYTFCEATWSQKLADWINSHVRAFEYLQGVPKHAYQYTEIKTVKVNIDYHVQYDSHIYSVPHQLVGEKIELHAKENLIELYFHHKRMASHVRKYYPGTTTAAEHMPIQHEKHHQWNAARLMNWAQEMGDEVLLWVQTLLQQKQHEEQAYRVCLGLLNLSRSYPTERLNKACAIANQNQLY